MNKILDSKFIPLIIFIILVLINIDAHLNDGSITGLNREGYILPFATIIAFIYSLGVFFKK